MATGNDADSPRKLAETALEQDKAATAALYDACKRGSLMMRIPAQESDHDILISAQLERVPLLASAMLKLLPFVEHTDECAGWSWSYGYPSVASHDGAFCDCGLDAALADVKEPR